MKKDTIPMVAQINSFKAQFIKISTNNSTLALKSTYLKILREYANHILKMFRKFKRKQKKNQKSMNQRTKSQKQKNI